MFFVKVFLPRILMFALGVMSIKVLCHLIGQLSILDCHLGTFPNYATPKMSEGYGRVLVC